LRHFEEMLARGFDGLTQENEEGWREVLFVDVAVNGDIARFDDGLGAVMFFEVEFDLLARGECVGREGGSRCDGFGAFLRFDGFGRRGWWWCFLGFGGDGYPAGGFALLILPFLDGLGVVVGADAALVFLKRHVGEAFAVKANDGGLEAVVTGGAEEFATEAAHGDGGEVAFRFFEFDFFGAVEGVEGGAAEDVVEGFFAGEEEAAVGRDAEEGLGAFFVAQETDAEAVAAGEDESGDVKEAEGVAGGADVGAEGVEAFVFGMDGDVNVLWDIDPFALGSVVALAGVASAEAAITALGAGAVGAAEGRAIAAGGGGGAAGAEGGAASASAILATARAALVTPLGAVVIFVFAGVGGRGFAEIGDPGGHDLQVREIEAGAFGGCRAGDR